ncbi:MOSC domain-containing protein [Nonomuraea sp. NN258]|uniref:MOSC domain-containing protein n=1 Tax=Nonomuraea antri TaxID=2730852 RepID=UPI001569A7D6|nr:MOSC domain-containing protein [Nonomuraea antri]NRQ30789.1 MOSC domain-containing protein [Nonomuraea antri]
MKLLSVNVGRAMPVDYTDAPTGMTGIDKRPAPGGVLVTPPSAKGSGVSGDDVCDSRFHGGEARAVYAFAREDLDTWERSLDRTFANGAFGENLTTSGLDVNEALIGERWRIGADLVLEVTGGRVPCRTFAGWVGEKGWIKKFTAVGRTGALLRVITPGEIRAGDPIEVVHRPDHDITVALAFRAVTLERHLLPRLLVAAEWLEPEMAQTARTYVEKYATDA